ncbi:MAG: Holliday junction resolvase RuvX [Bacteroidales bacterium]|nr:Holliday junction resolvase RuvX [Bacteroidales bacterium]
MRILAIDYGKKRTGIAVTDPLQIIAHALETVETNVLMTYLEKYLTTEEVEEIVVGHPKHADNTDADIFPEIKNFVNKLKNKFPKIKYTFWDERFTSKMAAKVLIDAGYKKKDRQKKGNLDKIAATIILQEYLQSK